MLVLLVLVLVGGAVTTGVLSSPGKDLQGRFNAQRSVTTTRSGGPAPSIVGGGAGNINAPVTPAPFTIDFKNITSNHSDLAYADPNFKALIWHIDMDRTEPVNVEGVEFRFDALAGDPLVDSGTGESKLKMINLIDDESLLGGWVDILGTQELQTLCLGCGVSQSIAYSTPIEVVFSSPVSSPNPNIHYLNLFPFSEAGDQFRVTMVLENLRIYDQATGADITSYATITTSYGDVSSVHREL